MKFVVVDGMLTGVSDVNFVKALEVAEAEGFVDWSEFGKQHGEVVDMTELDADKATELLTDVRAEREKAAKSREKAAAAKKLEKLKARMKELEEQAAEHEAEQEEEAA